MLHSVVLAVSLVSAWFPWKGSDQNLSLLLWDGMDLLTGTISSLAHSCHCLMHNDDEVADISALILELELWPELNVGRVTNKSHEFSKCDENWSRQSKCHEEYLSWQQRTFLFTHWLCTISHGLLHTKRASQRAPLSNTMAFKGGSGTSVRRESTYITWKCQWHWNYMNTYKYHSCKYHSCSGMGAWMCCNTYF